MRNVVFIFSFFLLTAHVHGQDALAGIWQTGEDNTKIETYIKDGAWFGKIISSDNPKAKIGTDILINFKKKGNEWHGRLYAAKKKKELDAVITTQNNKMNIEVTSGFITKELEWNKVKN